MIYHLVVIAHYLKMDEEIILRRLLNEEKANNCCADDLARVLCSMVLKNSNRQLLINDLENFIEYIVKQFNNGYTADRIISDLYKR